MGDSFSRMTDIFKDEESLRQLSELAEMLSSGDIPAEAEEEEAAQSSDMPDLGMIMKLAELAGSMNAPDKNTELLLALRPHLSEDARHRLDKAVKLLKLLAVYDNLKSSGLLNDLL